MMKKVGKISVLFISALFFISCEEMPVGVNFEPDGNTAEDTTYVITAIPAAQPKAVLFEDFTGVRCGNCPKGHDELKKIIAANPGKVVAVGLHPFNFLVATPITEDFRLQAANQVLTIIGSPLGLPYGSSDRMFFNGVTTLWAGDVNKRIGLTPPVNVEVSLISYNDATREVALRVKLTCTKALTEDLFITAGITEDKIVSPQVDDRQHGTVQEYEHNHLLRSYFVFARALNPAGNPTLEAGRVFERVFRVTLGNTWNRSNCNAVVFAHYQKEVLQAAEISVK